MVVDLEQEMQAFAKQARALADSISKEGSTPSGRGPEGAFQTRVNVDLASPPRELVEQLRNVAVSVGLYLKTRRMARA